MRASLTLIKENMGEKRAFTCPNPSCRKVFTTPLKTLNLQQQDSTEPYNACPYCLTKISEKPIKIEGKPEKVQLEKKQDKTKEKIFGDDEKPPACHYHMGYLSERTQKEQIPDECIVCKDIVDCMLRKMRE